MTLPATHAVPPAWRILAPGSLAGMHELHGRAIAEIVAAVRDRRGPDAAQRLRGSGVEVLHEVVDPLDVGPLRDRVLERLRADLLGLAVRVGRAVLGWEHEFYVDDYLILRVNVPYDVARSADESAENPGIGRVSPSMREIAAASRRRDPVYDPRAYHRGHPPAAWAHGPHVDSWTGHSRDGVNVWWAMSDVPAEAGMVLYPELAGTSVPRDPATLYARRGYPLPAPTFVPLAAGEMLVFDPEMLHGTHLNVTDRTRVAISLRLNARRPQFDPDCFYAREFWRRASDIEAGRLDAVLHLKREENLAPCTTAAPAAAPTPLGTVAVCAAGGERYVAVGPSSLVRDGERIVAVLPEGRVMLVRRDGALFALDAVCPHYGLDLADGGVRDDTVYCPGCAVGFDVATGRSASPTLALKTFAVREADGTIVIDRSR